MGTLMRATDWARTPLGAIGSWPQELKTMLGAVLGSCAPMAVWWGRELLQLYNDAYRVLLNDKHPAAFLAPASQVWASVWNLIGPTVQRVQEGAPAALNDNVHLFSSDLGTEKSLCAFSYSPIVGPGRTVDGLVHTVQPTTDKLPGEARLFTLSTDMVCIIGRDGYFKRVSPAFGVLGYEDAELLERPFLDFVHPRDQAATRAEIAKGAKMQPLIRFENRYRCKDGSYRWLLWNGALDEGAWYVIARDVTPARQAQDALARAKEAADAASDELESFSYSVAHDLRVPLRKVDGFSQALLEDCADKLDAEGRRYLSLVRASAQEMEVLIDDLLSLSRVTRSELHLEVIDMSAIARAAVLRLQRSEPHRQVEVVIAPEVYSHGDVQLLAIVFDNLFGNAWKFTRQREHAKVEFGVLAQTDEKVFFVRDNGAGFDMAYASKLFGVFQRLHSASEFEGTGIGLATVQRVVRRHQGRVWAEGTVDRGATFFFTLGETDLAA